MLAVANWPDALVTALLVSLLLVAAVLGIRLARLAHIPRVVGYLLMGLAAKWIMQQFFGGAEGMDTALSGAFQPVELIKSLALAIILFVIGLEFDSSHLRAVGGHVWKITVTEVACIFALVFLGTLIVSETHNPVQATFLAIAAIATAPAATLLVLQQYSSKGPVTDHILAMTGLNNIAAIILFYIAFLVFAELGPAYGGIQAEHMDHGLVTGILFATLGSAIIGFLLGLALSLAQEVLTRFETMFVYFAILLAIVALSKPMGLNSLIMCLFMGVAFTNFSIQPHRLREDLEPVTGPIFALFFVLAGFKLEVHLLIEVGAVGVVFLITRTLGKILGSWWGVRWIGPHHLVPKNIGAAMLCQAGVAIGLGKYLLDHWGQTVDGNFVSHAGAQSVNAIILASVAFFELVGPLATKRTVVQAGEVTAISLLTRPSGPPSKTRIILNRLRRAVRPQAASSAPTDESDHFTARYVMRTNIQSLRQDAKMSDVLKFVERSRLNHFYVVDKDGNLVGTINFSDLRHLMFNPIMVDIVTAYDMANTAPPLVMADQRLDEILELFHEHDVGSLPVIENPEQRTFLGVVEQRDVLRSLHRGNGADEEEEGH
jgi:Kef-type K+ transport system membrane component KefB/predicted transcriptional regulator